jgi:hypothetical protein
MEHGGWNGGYFRGQGNFAAQRVNIDGRVEEEELNWWDPYVRRTHNRPGSGMLPTLLEDYLHDADHTLFSVSASLPEIKPRHRSSESHSSASHPPVDPPSADDVRGSIPHPNAYYCPKHNGWVLLLWMFPDVNPPISKSLMVTRSLILLADAKPILALGENPSRSPRPTRPITFTITKLQWTRPISSFLSSAPIGNTTLVPNHGANRPFQWAP